MKRRKFFRTGAALLLAGFMKVPRFEDLLQPDPEPTVLLMSPTKEDAERYIYKQITHGIRYSITPELMADDVFSHLDKLQVSARRRSIVEQDQNQR